MVFGKNSSTTKAQGMPFSPSAQYAKNVGTVIQCLELQVKINLCEVCI